jgi:hypothetical protein
MTTKIDHQHIELFAKITDLLEPNGTAPSCSMDEGDPIGVFTLPMNCVT